MISFVRRLVPPSVPALLGTVLLGAALLGAFPLAARAQDAAEILTRHLYDGTLAQGETELAALAGRDAGDGKARFALGGLQFLRAVETLSQSLHRHGLEAPRTMFVPILRLPVPPNPHPEPLTYDGFRTILRTFADDLGRAEATLARVTQDDVKLPVDLARIHLDLDGDGKVEPGERLWTILAGVDPRARQNKDLESFPVTFDKGDVFWLRGYAHLIAGIAEFWLAHDFQPMFDQTFQLFFPHARIPASAMLGERSTNPANRDYPVLADAIAFLHLWHWPVTDRAGLQRAYDHFKAVPAMSRQSWAAILAETDDDHEWIPNPRQTNPFPSLPVTQERIDAWLKAMDQYEAILDGRSLVPHWRFTRGINLKRALLDHDIFDPVLWTTGTGVAAFQEDGPVISKQAWSDILRTFEGNFFGYAVWFN